MEFEFKKNNTLEKRIEQYEKIQKEYPEKLPIIIEKGNNSKIDKSIKSKYILARNLTMAELIKIIRGKLEIEPEMALFFLANGKHTIPTSETLGDIYEMHKDKQDGFLYISYSEEMVYGF